MPAFVTAIGLIFAVLTERVRWSVAFKTAVFMPMAISLLAAGVIWRLMYVQDPNQGTVNAAIAAVKGVVEPTGALPTALPSTPQLSGQPRTRLTLKKPLRRGEVAPLGLSAIPPENVPNDAKQAVKPPRNRTASPASSGGTSSRVEACRQGREGELGLPGVTLDLRDRRASRSATAKSADDGTFAFAGLGAGNYTVAISSQTFSQPFGGISWLGDKLITPAIMIAYIWVWAGFAMVVVAAGSGRDPA